MTHRYKIISTGFWLSVLSVTVSAQGVIQLKNGEKLALEKTLFPMKTIDCDVMDCGSNMKKILIKDICKAAICLPVEAKDVPKVLGPDVLHWRIKKDDSMAQFLGSVQLSNYTKANNAILLDVSTEQIKSLPIVGLKNSSGSGAVQYWVRVK